MVIDTSAIVAILRNEPEAAALEKSLVGDPVPSKIDRSANTIRMAEP